MSGIPKKIYLQFEEDPKEDGFDDTTWSDDRIHDYDVEYVLTDHLSELEFCAEQFANVSAELDELKAQLNEAKREANDIENKRQLLHAKLAHEIKCHNQTQEKCDELRADKFELKAQLAESELNLAVSQESVRAMAVSATERAYELAHERGYVYTMKQLHRGDEFYIESHNFWMVATRDHVNIRIVRRKIERAGG